MAEKIIVASAVLSNKAVAENDRISSEAIKNYIVEAEAPNNAHSNDEARHEIIEYFDSL